MIAKIAVKMKIKCSMKSLMKNEIVTTIDRNNSLQALNCITESRPLFPPIPPLKCQKTSGFLMLSKGIERSEIGLR